MEILRFYNKSRYTLNPTHLSRYFLLNSKTLAFLTPSISTIPTPEISLFPHVFSSIALSKCISPTFDLYCSTYNKKIQYFSTCTNNVRVSGFDKDQKHFSVSHSSGDITRILDIVKADGKDMKSSLDSIGSSLSRWAIIDILTGLNVAKVPALRFFEWVRDVHPDYYRNADICGLMIDNCGRLGDHVTMLALLKDFRTNRICLTSNAFGFLTILSSTREVAQGSIKGVITVLNEVGGSCRNSGIHSLLELLCSQSSFDLARFVMEITEKKESYYNVMVKHLCVKGQFDVAKNVLEEMWQSRCEPEAKVYNYLISSLCKINRVDEAYSIMLEMIDRGCPPDVITFEILIYFACRYGRPDNAVVLYNQMISRGIRPRVSTHSAFIRGFFGARQFEKAYRYVLETSAKDNSSAQECYNVLTALHLKYGDLLFSHNLLVEMIEKGLRPKHSLYLRVSKRLYKTGKGQFAKNLNDRFSSLMQKIRKNDG